MYLHHSNLAKQVVEGSPFIYKGTNPDVDSYSAFWDNSKLAATTLFSELSAKEVTDVFICGLAYDVCVGTFLTFRFSLQKFSFVF